MLKKSSLKPSQLRAHVDATSLRSLATHLLETGKPVDEVVQEVVAAMDAMIPWATVLSAAGPVGTAVGVVVELLDGPVATLIATGIVRAAAKARAKAAAKSAAKKPKKSVTPESTP